MLLFERGELCQPIVNKVFIDTEGTLSLGRPPEVKIVEIIEKNL